MIQPPDLPQDLADFIRDNPLAAVYFTGPECAVCQALKPRLFALFAERFPAMALVEVDCSREPAAAAQRRVFAVPTLVVYLDGREHLRRARAFSLVEVAEALGRPYAILTGS